MITDNHVTYTKAIFLKKGEIEQEKNKHSKRFH